MRRPNLSVVLAVVAGAAVLAACGEAEKPRTRGPSKATYTSTTAAPTSDVRDGDCPKANNAPITRGFDVRIAGQDGKARRRPRKLEVAREITLGCLRWSGWGGAQARASGIANELNCEPTCATGAITQRRARLTVSQLERCRGRRYYSQARLLYVSDPNARSLKVFTVVPCPR